MDILWTLALTAVPLGLAAGFAAAHLLRRRRPDPHPETQDDFRASMARWGYLHDRREGR